MSKLIVTLPGGIGVDDALGVAVAAARWATAGDGDAAGANAMCSCGPRVVQFADGGDALAVGMYVSVTYASYGSAPAPKLTEPLPSGNAPEPPFATVTRNGVDVGTGVGDGAAVAETTFHMSFGCASTYVYVAGGLADLKHESDAVGSGVDVVPVSDGATAVYVWFAPS
jgi:hypothetical protein